MLPRLGDLTKDLATAAAEQAPDLAAGMQQSAPSEAQGLGGECPPETTACEAARTPGELDAISAALAREAEQAAAQKEQAAALVAWHDGETCASAPFKLMPSVGTWLVLAPASNRSAGAVEQTESATEHAKKISDYGDDCQGMCADESAMKRRGQSASREALPCREVEDQGKPAAFVAKDVCGTCAVEFSTAPVQDDFQGVYTKEVASQEALPCGHSADQGTTTDSTEKVRCHASPASIGETSRNWERLPSVGTWLAHRSSSL